MVILLVAFGSAEEKAMEVYDIIEKKVEETFPSLKVYWAFSSAWAREQFAKRGKKVLSPAQALALLGDIGYHSVAVQSLHVVPGQEYHDLLQTINAMQNLPKGLDTISLGLPLLSSPEDIETMAKVFHFQNLDFLTQGGVIYIGHGSAQPVFDLAYPALQHYLGEQHPNLFVTTLEGSYSNYNILSYIQKRGIFSVHLIPLMTVAGKHVSDIASGSLPLCDALKKAGITYSLHKQGLGQNEAAVNLWLKHLVQAVISIDGNSEA